MWGWIVVLAVLLFIAMIPVSITADYNELGTKVLLKIGPAWILLYPPKKTSKEEKPDSKKSAGGSAQSPDSYRPIGGKLSDFLPILQTLLDFLKNLRRRIRVNDLTAKLTLAGGDPCDLSVNYGRTCAVVSSLQPQLDRLFRIKKQNIQVACDYISEETTVQVHVELSIVLLRLFALIVRFGLRILKQYISIKNQRKGGTEYEPKSSSNA